MTQQAETVDAAFAARQAHEQATREALRVADALANVALRDMPNVDELRRLAGKFQRLRKGRA